MSLAASLSLILLLACIISPLHCNSQQDMDMGMEPLERETLFKVMESMSSDKNWRVSCPEPCKPGSLWFGIDCKQGNDGHLHVTKLTFGNFPNPSCKKTAIFPSEVFNLPYLQSLFVFNCFKTTKTSLNVPTLSRKSPQADTGCLQQLSIKSNPALVSVIPEHISSLSSLQVLTLSQNGISGRIPETISSLTSLVHLDLSYNSLTGTIPEQINGLRSLVDLDLSYNSLKGSIPASLGQLDLLQKLDLSSNSLTGAIPESLGDLSFLSFLALSNNKLTGPFPRGLPKLQSLQYFIMDDNPMFIPLPFQLGRLTKLQELRLANSGYTGSIPGSFAWLKNLTTLSLQNNKLSGEIPAAIGGLSRIYHFNLSGNMLSGVVPFDPSFLKRLGRNLDLSGNSGLCFFASSDQSESSVLLNMSGVGVCGTAGNTSMQKPFKSAASPIHLNKFSKFFIALLVLFLTHFHLNWLLASCLTL